MKPPRSEGAVVRPSNKAAVKGARKATDVVVLTKLKEPEMQVDTELLRQSWTVTLAEPSVRKGSPKLRPSTMRRSGVALLPLRKLASPDC